MSMWLFLKKYFWEKKSQGCKQLCYMWAQDAGAFLAHAVPYACFGLAALWPKITDKQEQIGFVEHWHVFVVGPINITSFSG